MYCNSSLLLKSSSSYISAINDAYAMLIYNSCASNFMIRIDNLVSYEIVILSKGTEIIDALFVASHLVVYLIMIYLVITNYIDTEE